jgi:hypothetical protein
VWLIQILVTLIAHMEQDYHTAGRTKQVLDMRWELLRVNIWATCARIILHIEAHLTAMWQKFWGVTHYSPLAQKFYNIPNNWTNEYMIEWMNEWMKTCSTCSSVDHRYGSPHHAVTGFPSPCNFEKNYLKVSVTGIKNTAFCQKKGKQSKKNPNKF